MSQTAWIDEDDPRLRKALTYSLRKHVRHQDGANSEAPSVIFADADYEVGDGKCGLHEDAKSANEPAIVYVRADAYLAVISERDALRAALCEFGDRSKMGQTLRLSLEAYAENQQTS